MGIDVEINMSGWDDIIQDMENLSNKQLEYGFPDNVMHPEANQPLHLIAFWNNYGTKNSITGQWYIPPRNFLTDAAVLSEFSMEKLNMLIMHSIGEGTQSLNRSLDRVGKDLSDMVREQITEGDYRALSPNTIAAKQSDTILIETGFLFDNVKHKVSNKPKGV